MPRCSLLLALALTACAHGSRLVHVAPPTPVLVFSNVRVFDGVELLASPMDVIVRDGRIATLAPSGTVPLPAEAQVVRTEGRTLLPGLWDAHTHLGDGTGGPPWIIALPHLEEQGAAYVYCGVTSVLGASAGVTRAYVEAVDRGEIIGPHALRSTRMLTMQGGHPTMLMRTLAPWFARAYVAHRLAGEVVTEEDGREMVRSETGELEPDFVKLVYDATLPGTARLPLPVLRAMIAEAHRADRRVLVHTGSAAEAVDAAEAGAAVVMHAPWQGLLTGEQIERISASGAAVVTTLSFWESLDAALRGRLVLSDLERAVLPDGFAEAYAHPPRDWRPADLPQRFLDGMPELARTTAENVRRLHAAGVRLLAGSDSGLPAVLHGGSLHRELQALVRAGLSPIAVLQMATSRPADTLSPERGAGHIAPGALADLLLVDGNPAERIEDIDRIAGVFLRGRAIERAPAPQPPVAR